MSKRILVSVALLVGCTVACFGQGKVSDFIQTKSWSGKVTIKGSGSGSTSALGIRDVWSFSIDNSLDVTLTQYNPNFQGWTGTFKGTGKLVAEDKSTMGNCVEDFSMNFDGTLGMGKTFTLILQDPNQYAFYPSDYVTNGVTSKVTADCAPGSQGGTGAASWSPVLSDKFNTLPAPGQPLTGSYITKMNAAVQPVSAAFGGQPAIIDVTVEWALQPGSPDELELVVTSTDAYKNWRPQAGPNGARGNSLNLVAELRNKSGKPVTPSGVYFDWEFTSCSKVPGYAMNAPLQNPSMDYDMKFEPGPDGLMILDPPNAQKARSRPAMVTKSTATIASYDWGGYAKVKVTATFADTKQLVGYLEGDPSQQEVRVPKRPAEGYIAEKWKTDNNTTADDSSDSENDPVGDGTPGDGLTLYEEYRGFIIGNKHEEGDPKRKDYFITNMTAASTREGINWFESMSGLKVHKDLRDTEIRADRVINPNHPGILHVTDQHAVRLKSSPSNGDMCYAIGGPGNPKKIDHVEILVHIVADEYAADDWASVVAHELFHSVNVWHHGEGNKKVTWKMTDDGVLENGTPVTVETEDQIVTPPAMNPGDSIKVPKGLPQDSHSGLTLCVMRYSNARTYEFEKDHSVRFIYDPETPGGSLCDQVEGIGFNDPNRTDPQPRYGNAADGRGKCKNQILVNDRVQAPTR